MPMFPDGPLRRIVWETISKAVDYVTVGSAGALSDLIFLKMMVRLRCCLGREIGTVKRMTRWSDTTRSRH